MTEASPILRVPPDAAPSADLVERVVALLREGAVVALPTETVYGLAVRADRADTVARLAELKGRPADRAFTWHVGSGVDEALSRFPEPWHSARRLARRYWPGPLTLVLHGVPEGLEPISRGGWTGIRCPAQPATQQVLGAAEFPIAMTSANVHGEAPLADAREIAQRWPGGAIELVVDAGPPRLGEASAVLQLGPRHFSLLRQGLLDEDKLRDAAGLRIGFVCTGNTCRSPMAEGLARRLLATRLGAANDAIERFGFEVASFGVFALPGAPAADEAVVVMRREGIDISGHHSRVAEPEALESFDVLYALTAGHLAALAERAPERVVLDLLDPAGNDIPDPIGQGAAAYERTARTLRAALEARVAQWV